MHHKRKSVPTSLTKLYQDGCSALPFEIHIVPGPETMKMPFGPSSKPPKCNFNFIFINKINKFIV
jgi:hypothetical protein